MTAVIRLAAESDAPTLLAIYAPYVRETAISFELEAPDEGEMAARVRKTLLAYPWLVCEHDGHIIGYAYGSRYRERPAYQWSVEVTVYVQRDLHRSGVGRALYTSLFALLRLQGYVSAFAGIALPNDASIGVHRALGFEPIGIFRAAGYKFDAWHDVAWMRLALQPPPAVPTPPQPLSAVLDTDEGRAALRAGLAFLRL
jgi:phosphinothricin acetyltransferase